jgi:membrane fusion protein, heavy metal efflux system
MALGKRRWVIGVLGFALLIGGGIFASQYSERWWSWTARPPSGVAVAPETSASIADDHAEFPTRDVVKISPQARRNLGLVSRPLQLQNYWRSILVPGEIVDRPGVSDRRVTAPAVGVVTQVHAFPGDTVRPGDRLFTLRLLSEYIQNSQSELFKATRETQLAQEQRDRLAKAAEGGALPQARLVEIDQQLRRLQTSIQAYRQDLLTRGLRPEQLNDVTEGKFVATIDVLAPPAVTETAAVGTVAARAASHDVSSATGELADRADAGADVSQPLIPEAGTHTTTGGTDTTPLAGVTANGTTTETTPGFAYEVQELNVDLGTQVTAGQALAVLANHRALYLSGHAFKREASALEQAAQQRRPVRVEFAEDDSAAWPPLEHDLTIRHLANSIDTVSRTFQFFIPLTNQSRSYEQDGLQLVVWRFRPGQRARLNVPVEELKDVFVLPMGAVVREGPETYVFRQNGDLFDRRPVHVLHQDRTHAVLANDGSVFPGWFLAQGSAASLNRVLKAQASGGAPSGVHVHADGSIHGDH